MLRICYCIILSIMNRSIFLYDYWREKSSQLKQKFLNSDPFSHVIFDDFLPVAVAEKLLLEFPHPNIEKWNHYYHFNTKKLASKDLSGFGAVTQELIGELNSASFLKFLEEVSGIKGLIADKDLEGGGLHQIEQGGYLNIHADFTVHPHNHNWKRRLNLIIYLNKDWKEGYGGHIEFWKKDMKTCAVKVLPIFNKAVLFATDKDSFHGHPEPLNCPLGNSRKSIALYYFTLEINPEMNSTNFKSRPSDSFYKSVAIYIDKKMLRVYDLSKRIFGFDDKTATKILKFLHRSKSKPPS